MLSPQQRGERSVMQSAFEASNPFEFWAKANMAAVAATMELIKAATTATTAVVERQPARPSAGSQRRELARPSYETRAAEIRGSATSPSKSSPSSPTGRSWYRAPYRSPFDPMFWMTPGHPVDHVSDWMGPAMAAGAALGNPFATPFAAPFASTLPDWKSAAWMSPMAMWANMMPNTSSAGDAADRAQTNVVDFETAYAAYRTAGGHASAQILQDRPRKSPPAHAVEASAAPWPLPFMLFGWPPRFS